MELDENLNNKLESNIYDNFSNELKTHLEKNVKNFSIDRFEESFAVCEDLESGEMINIEISKLPESCKEGSIITLENGIYSLNIEKTLEKQEKISKMVNNLFKRK